MTEGGFRDQCVVAHTLAAFATLSTRLRRLSTEAFKHPDKAKADTEVAAVILPVRRGSPRSDDLNKMRPGKSKCQGFLRGMHLATDWR